MRALRSRPGLDWELDTSSREIVRDGRRVRLAEKPFLVLQALFDAEGDVVTRASLRKLLWPDDTFVDFDNNLNSAVATFSCSGQRRRPLRSAGTRGRRAVRPAPGTCARTRSIAIFLTAISGAIHRPIHRPGV